MDQANLTSGLIEFLRPELERFPFPASMADPDQPDCPLIWANQEFSNLTGFALLDIRGQNCRFLQGDIEQDTSEIRTAVRNRAVFRGHILNKKRNGATFVNSLIIRPVEFGRKCYLVGFQDERLWGLREASSVAAQRTVNRVMQTRDVMIGGWCAVLESRYASYRRSGGGRPTLAS